MLARASQNADLRHIEIALCRADIMHFFNNYLYTDRNDSLFGQDVPRVMPFIPMDFQKELILEVWNSIINGTFSAKDRWDFTNVFVEKSRQMGVSWLIMAVFLYGWLFHGHKYHVISQKETDVDKIGDMRSLFEKLRFMINNLPQWMLPEGFSKHDLGKCDHAFGFDGASYEVGVIRKNDGTYTILWDFYSPGGLLPHMGGDTADKFRQAYALEKTKIEARKKGMIVREKTLPNGAIQLSIGKL